MVSEAHRLALALSEGDLSKRARCRTAELANDADLRVLPPRAAQAAAISKVSSAKRNECDPRVPAAGQILRRLYKGRWLHFRILPQGFEFEGGVYPTAFWVTTIMALGYPIISLSN